MNAYIISDDDHLHGIIVYIHVVSFFFCTGAYRLCRFFIWLLLGPTLNLRISRQPDRLKFKKDYEAFKLVMSLVLIALLLLAYYVPFKIFDVIAFATMCYYYISLTVRETVLKMNGSRINMFWIFHHYMSIFGFLALCIWESSPVYENVRKEVIGWLIFMLVVHLIQYKYQTSRLYVLQSVGLAESTTVTNMDTPVGLQKTFVGLIPILFGLYAVQARMGWTLISAYSDLVAEILHEVGADTVTLEVALRAAPPLVAGMISFILSVGNAVTTVGIVFRKLKHTLMQKGKDNEKRESAKHQ